MAALELAFADGPNIENHEAPFTDSHILRGGGFLVVVCAALASEGGVR
jgi:hypothetical protein